MNQEINITIKDYINLIWITPLISNYNGFYKVHKMIKYVLYENKCMKLELYNKKKKLEL